MFRKVSIIVACSALLPFVAGAAQAKGGKHTIRIDQKIAGASLYTPDELGGGVGDGTFEGKGAPGKSNLRDLLEYGPAGPPSVRCGGFDFELSIVSGSAVVTFADQSQLYASVDSGYTCGNVADGARRTVLDTSIVGGAGRFAGAAGTAHADIDGVAIGGLASGTGTIEGTASID